MVDIDDIVESMTIEEIHNLWKSRDQHIIDSAANIEYPGTTNYIKFEILLKRFELMQGVLSLLFKKLT